MSTQQYKCDRCNHWVPIEDVASMARAPINIIICLDCETEAERDAREAQEELV